MSNEGGEIDEEHGSKRSVPMQGPRKRDSDMVEEEKIVMRGQDYLLEEDHAKTEGSIARSAWARSHRRRGPGAIESMSSTRVPVEI